MEKRKAALAIICALAISLSSATAFAERRPHEMGGIEKLQSFLTLFDNYLTVSEKWVKMVSTQETTIYMVVEKIVEIHKDKGDKAKAVPELRKLLAKYGGNATIRNVIHFKIVEIYKDSGQAGKALDELAAIVGADR